MRTFSTVFVIVALSLIANASTMYQRASTTGIQKCAADLATVRSSIATSARAIYDFTDQNEIESIDPVVKATDGLIADVENASQICCALPVHSLTKDEKDFMSDEANLFFNDVELLVNTLLTRYYKRITSYYNEKISEFPRKLEASAPKLEQCLTARSPIKEMVDNTALNYELEKVLAQTKIIYVPLS